MIRIPLAKSNWPVMPLASQLGDHLARIARLQSFSRAISKVRLAPAWNSLVRSGPVVKERFSFSGQVSNTRPPMRLHGGRGTGRPPRTSGQTWINSTSRCSRRYRFTNEDMPTQRPCHRHGSPSRQDDTNTFLSFENRVFMAGNFPYRVSPQQEEFLCISCKLNSGI